MTTITTIVTRDPIFTIAFIATITTTTAGPGTVITVCAIATTIDTVAGVVAIATPSVHAIEIIGTIEIANASAGMIVSVTATRMLTGANVASGVEAIVRSPATSVEAAGSYPQIRPK